MTWTAASGQACPDGNDKQLSQITYEYSQAHGSSFMQINHFAEFQARIN
jgi:hypothetical protein